MPNGISYRSTGFRIKCGMTEGNKPENDRKGRMPLDTRIKSEYDRKRNKSEYDIRKKEAQI